MVSNKRYGIDPALPTGMNGPARFPPEPVKLEVTMEAPDSSTIAVLAEKPSVARDIARVLGANKQGQGYLQGNGYVVTWAIGHLVALAQPHEMNPEWRRWRKDLLPMLPDQWPLVVNEKTKDQFEIVRKIVNSRRVSRIVCATDAGREGELIFRYIYEAADCEKPFERLWISSLTSDAIRKGFEALRPGADYDSLADAACGRSRADWLVGMNLSRAYSLAFNEELSVGRVQTPTLAMVVERELILRRFVPEEYAEVIATFHPIGAAEEIAHQGTWFRTQPGDAADRETLPNSMRLAPDGLEAKAIVERARTGQAKIESVESETQRTPPPMLYDLTELQRHANRLFGFSAQKTLDLAQTLYERYKLISYPRTDSRHLSQDVAKSLRRVVDAVKEQYLKHLAPGTSERPLGRRFVDDAKISDHHAIIPTTVRADKTGVSGDERKIYDLICMRLLSAWHDDYIVAVTTVITTITSPEIMDRYHTSGTAELQIGWKVLDLTAERKKSRKGEIAEEAREQSLPADLAPGQTQDVRDAKLAKKKTRPPKRFTEATLLTAMESAGKSLDERELSEAMKDSGLGTPATRAAIIEVLLKRAYIVRTGKSLEATDKGIRLIEVVHPEVKSPAMTGQWEAYLQRIQRGAAKLEPFLEGIGNYVREVVGKTGQAALARVLPKNAVETGSSVRSPVAAEDKSLEELLHDSFGFASFRPNQEPVCRAVIEGKDVLLVMPTGAGKSLCYQLPGLVRRGTTLVISPLIALMEDQVTKLQQQGFAVERIHSGRQRQAARQACFDYLEGKLQFLFVAPERFRVSGFAAMLAKRKPILIAIDEAHCISQWGHDFRPDYRMLGQYLPMLRPAPVIALTATATPSVQKDVTEQLGLAQAARFIHGFRRENIAIEIVECAPSLRSALICEILSDASHRPAIVYAPTRKQTDALASDLSAICRTAAYHAGLDGQRRTQVQQNFLAGGVEVMVATTAFGMGIDKPDVRTVVHAALPSSLEGYYQEIGRAGRDGAPSRAILMQSYADRYTHDFFFERDYPDVTVLDSIYERLGAEPVAKTVLQSRLKMEPDLFDKALEKLWTHAGAALDYEENVTRGAGRWRELYVAQGAHKTAQIDRMIRYARSSQCRMASLVRHFGDFTDGTSACGICDFCAPMECVAQKFRAARTAEIAIFQRAWKILRSGGPRSTGKLHTELCPNLELSRDEFEQVLGAMGRAGLAEHQQAVFEKDGKQIPYQIVKLTREGQAIEDPAAIELLMKETAAVTGMRVRRKRRVAVKKSRVAAMQSSGDNRLEGALRAWRQAEAKRHAIPAFRIFSDQVLRTIAVDRPATEQELLAINGVGMSTARRYGSEIYRIVRSVSGSES